MATLPLGLGLDQIASPQVLNLPDILRLYQASARPDQMTNGTGAPDGTPSVTAPMASAQPAPAPAPPQLAQADPKPTTWGPQGKGWQWLGVLGDALQVAGGREATFLPAVQASQQNAQKQLNDLLAAKYKSDMDLQKEIAAAAAKRKIEAANPLPTSEQSNFNFYQGLDPQSRMAFDAFHPITSMGPNGVQVISHGDIARALGINGPPVVSSEADLAKLPPGSFFTAPDGHVYRTKGGAGSNASGNFPH